MRGDDYRGITAAILARVRGLASRRLVDGVRQAAQQCILDWCGVAIAACAEPLSNILVELATSEGARGQATVVGQSGSFSARQAALVNGAMGHALDYDDTHPAARAHVTASVLPAALAAAELAGASGEQLLAAFVAGYEATVMVSAFNGATPYERGFHGTGVFGPFGACVASGLLLGLDEVALARGLGIAGTQSAALRGQFGTMCKPLHAGRAAEAGLVGAQLAALGFGGADDVIECALGFTDAHGGAFDVEACLAPALRGAHIRECVFKFHAACHGVHAVIESAAALVRTHRVQPADVESVVVRLAPALQNVCNLRAPRTGLEAKFSAAFNAVLAVHGLPTENPDTYSDAVVERPDLHALERRVSVKTDREGRGLCADVELRLRSGQTLSASHDADCPAHDPADHWPRILRKFNGLAAPALGQARAAEIATIVRELDTVPDVRRLTSLLASARGANRYVQ